MRTVGEPNRSAEQVSQTIQLPFSALHIVKKRREDCWNCSRGNHALCLYYVVFRSLTEGYDRVSTIHKLELEECRSSIGCLLQ